MNWRKRTYRSHGFGGQIVFHFSGYSKSILKPKKSRPSPLIFLSSNFSDRITRYSRSFQFHLASVQSFNFLIHPIHIHKYQDGTNCKTLSKHLPQAELGGRNENSVEVCRSHFKRDGNAGVWGAWGTHLRIILSTRDIFTHLSDISRFALIFQRKRRFQSKIFDTFLLKQNLGLLLRFINFNITAPSEKKLS